MKSDRILPSSLCAVLVCAMLFPAAVWSQADLAAPPPVDVTQKAAQADKAAADALPPSLRIEIPDAPKGIDPATLLPPAMAAKVTVEFQRRPLRDIVKWLQQEQKINVLVNYRELADAKILVGEPITDRLDDEPVYLMLNRLKSMGIGWYYEDDALHLSTEDEVDEHKTTIPYNLSDLFDNGYKPRSILKTLIATKHPNDEDAVLLGDVLFLRHNQQGHIDVSGLLAALRKHGRRTFISDPPQHETWRQKLTQNVTVQFDSLPLNAAISELVRQTDADIRLDMKGLQDSGVAERTPITLKMANQPLGTVLRAMLLNEELTWMLNDGVIWITTIDIEDGDLITAVFDVRDLCNGPNESNALMGALKTQTRAKWEDAEGEGGRMVTPKTGVLVVRQSQQILNDLLKLLESYRTALRSSKPRPSVEIDPKELITKYYRLPKDIATDLEHLVREDIQPDTWKSSARPAAAGTIRTVASRSGVIGNGQHGSVLSYTVLIIYQTREIHGSIEKLIAKVLNGDAGDIYRSDGTMQPGMGGMGGMGGGMTGGMGGGMGGMGGGVGGSSGGGTGGMGGMGGDGFGGGFFSIPSKPIESLRDKSSPR